MRMHGPPGQVLCTHVSRASFGVKACLVPYLATTPWVRESPCGVGSYIVLPRGNIYPVFCGREPKKPGNFCPGTSSSHGVQRGRRFLEQGSWRKGGGRPQGEGLSDGRRQGQTCGKAGFFSLLARALHCPGGETLGCVFQGPFRWVFDVWPSPLFFEATRQCEMI